jgi:hypothetical protein
MRARGLFWIARASLRADRSGAILDVAAACTGAAALVFVIALGLGVGMVARRMFPADARLVEVIPADVSLSAILGGGQLDRDALTLLGALPGVEAAWPRITLRVPIAAPEPPPGLEGIWPPGMTLQLPAVGLAPEMVQGDLDGREVFADPGPGGAIPVMLSRRLLEVYDRTIAPAWNLRRLPPGVSPVGLELAARVGVSVVPGRTEARVEPVRLRLVGLSDRVPLYLLAMPLDSVRRLHAEYGKREAGYTQVTLLARRPDDVPAIAAAVRRMGFSVDEAERATAERVGAAVAVTTGALALLALSMCLLAALAIARSLSASVRGRAKEIAILRAVGAAPRDVRMIVLLHGGTVGLAGGLAGTLLAVGLALAADRAAVRLLPEFPFRPDSFFLFPAWLLALGLAVPAVAAVLGALAPAAAAARVQPARTLS